ncbi:hypothetical protein GCM10010869_38860 [Mesorhizobium tianshanense]|uniref:Uncharacterized protein DUF768 n=1 Tax=Mesorhizobium tianshanense TaxID=39844 RepID=A0A562NY64_9HYPH|nr:DUF768 domain-containing protein [Mesorhizobium tianshanense]TWI36676.1 uncharacterized protein DUF768 [Mesorhizobium tianshanense]GLS38292.1 hypothetical protein GCM10010869_38860 [Mesorhizobium tianshanense]
MLFILPIRTVYADIQILPISNVGDETELAQLHYRAMCTRGADFSYRWISTPEGPVKDPMLAAMDLADETGAADAEGIAIGEIGEEIGRVREVIIHALCRPDRGRAGVP